LKFIETSSQSLRLGSRNWLSQLISMSFALGTPGAEFREAIALLAEQISIFL